MLFLIGATASMAQKPFPQVFKSQWPVDVKWREYNYEKTLALGGDLREISMMDATNGKILWTMNFKEKFNIKKANSWEWDTDKGAVYVKFKTDEKDVEQTVYFDEKTGEKIDDYNTRVAKVKTKRQNPWKSYTSYAASYSDKESNVNIDLIYTKKVVASATGKGTKTDITVLSSGKYSWSTTFQGRLIRALCDNAMGSGFGGDYINLVVGQGKVFVVYEGLSCFDLTTGNKLWETTFDNADMDFGLLKSRQTLGRAAMPMVAEDGVYVVDLSKGNKKIKKFDLSSGKVIWESPEFGKDDVIPDLHMAGNTLIARFGGKIETQTYIPGTDGRPDVCKREFKPVGPFGVKAYDAATGKLLWETSKMKELGDKMSTGTSNILVSGSNIIFASAKNFYCMEAATGKVVFKTDISKSGIGAPDEAWVRKDAVIIEGATGVASLNKTSGSLNFATKTKKNFGSFGTPDAYYVWIGKSVFERQDFVRVDLDNGQILGVQKATGYPYFTPDYEEFIKFDGNKVFRFKTRP